MSNLASPPSPVGSARTDEGEADHETNGLHLELAPFGLEHIGDYELDGHHPVHLGDIFGNNYQYFHSFHDLRTDLSQVPIWIRRRLKYPRSYIWSNTGYTMHICFPFGPWIPKCSIAAVAKLVDDTILHSEAICHGDITPNNILHRVSGLDGLSEDEVLQILRKPIVNPVLIEFNEPHNESTVPKYLVYPVSWGEVNVPFISKVPCLIDFGESFEWSQHPEDLGTPGPYRSPELILERKVGDTSDAWALGCSLFEIRTGRKLFSPFGDEDDEYLDAMVQVLGPLPEPWWSTTWKDRRRLYKDGADEKGLAVNANAPELGQDASVRHKKSAITSWIHPSVAVNARSLQDKMSPGLWYMSDHGPAGDDHREISHREKEVFADLLGQMLKYKPEERIFAKDAVEHKWFEL